MNCNVRKTSPPSDLQVGIWQATCDVCHSLISDKWKCTSGQYSIMVGFLCFWKYACWKPLYYLIGCRTSAVLRQDAGLLLESLGVAWGYCKMLLQTRGRVERE